MLAYDLAAAPRDAGIPVISGFHTSVEKDCLDFLLKGRQPVVVVPARSGIDFEVAREPGALLDALSWPNLRPPRQ